MYITYLEYVTLSMKIHREKNKVIATPLSEMLSLHLSTVVWVGAQFWFLLGSRSDFLSKYVYTPYTSHSNIKYDFEYFGINYVEVDNGISNN